jgi:NADPH:quinone reductase-like Zn-dependent oxidoreductase
MRAALYDRFGGPEVVEIREVPEPRAARGQILLRVRAAALNPKDVYFRRGLYRALSGARFPKLLGYDVAGEVSEVGPGVRGIAVGDRRFGFFQGFRGRKGTVAERFSAEADETAAMPGSMSFEEGAALGLAGATALQALRDVGHLREGGRVCIHGASGGVGVHAIQIAKILGAHVTSVTSARNLDLARAFGADETLDRERDQPFARSAAYDLVFDAWGNQRFEAVRRSLAPRGTFVSTVPSVALAVDLAKTAVRLADAPAARLVIVRARGRDLETLSGWVGDGRLKPVVDRTFPLAEIREAFAYLETKRARGKVVVTP